MKTATEAQRQIEADRDERQLNKYIEWFVRTWTEGMGPVQRSQFTADFVMVVQAVHADASRTTHALLKKSLAAMPPQTIFIPTKTE